MSAIHVASSGGFKKWNYMLDYLSKLLDWVGIPKRSVGYCPSSKHVRGALTG